MIGQAVRGTGGQVPVVPFIWPFTGSKPMYNSYYENGTHITNGSTHASPALIRAMIETTYEAGGAAALFWVDEVTEDKERKKNASFVLSASSWRFCDENCIHSLSRQAYNTVLAAAHV